MAERWVVRECSNCALLWPAAITICNFCARRLPDSVEVVKAQGARTSDPDTSKLAALAQQPRSGSQRARILEFLRVHGPKTSREIEEALSINGAWKRVSELKQGGHIYELESVHDYATGSDVTVYAAGSPAEVKGALF